MLIRIEAPIMLMGSKLVQYLPSQNWNFSRGDIVEVNDNDLLADFGDLVIRFTLSEVFYAIDTDLREEHYATINLGLIESDFRIRKIPMKTEPHINEARAQYRSNRTVRRGVGRRSIQD